MDLGFQDGDSRKYDMPTTLYYDMMKLYCSIISVHEK